MMARYNAWQNGWLIDAVAAMDDDALRAERGAFFGSILGTLSHLLWGDLVWMSRLAGGPPPGGSIRETATFVRDAPRWAERRRAADAGLSAWADGLGAPPAVVRWHSGVLGREVERPWGLVVTHVFNHQTHHRGQVHAMLTAAGARTEDTDLIFMPEP
jgi:uncharacterized damage-inducible protein DinB